MSLMVAKGREAQRGIQALTHTFTKREGRGEMESVVVASDTLLFQNRKAIEAMALAGDEGSLATGAVKEPGDAYKPLIG